TATPIAASASATSPGTSARTRRRSSSSRSSPHTIRGRSRSSATATSRAATRSPRASDPPPTPGDPSPARATTASPTRSAPIGSFNQLAKLNDRVLDVWARVLLAVPDARLIIWSPGVSEREPLERVAARLERFGVARDRLELRTAAPLGEYLRAHAEVDVALDPFPF